MISPEVAAIVAGGGVVAIAALFAFLPLAGAHRAPAAAPQSELNDAAARRFAIYRQLLDLELDHRTGKLSAEDQALFTSELLAQASVLLREESQEMEDLNAAIEREIAAARQALEVRRTSQPISAPPR